ncbi:hypothetical protein [Nostoc sp. 'Peltigera malacea cyanobiont' DB3992]|uniref:hypothetical protein n=1 Tax=Nostoc sp. 'Peltigera malacea cyanobiont' DB3992 TaxID=1206980 RepID=UPI000C05F5D8|nr:hypothetical protein [Nostoc sp. 'Peltigera malacea cyanobiont' DB3992]PHM05959.1 hypothetical protein CK516_37100 [Nostoc sp. 'Peltigera malacea cyanobiont' DB3992]
MYSLDTESLIIPNHVNYLTDIAIIAIAVHLHLSIHRRIQFGTVPQAIAISHEKEQSTVEMIA